MPLSKRNRRNLLLLLMILGAIIISPRILLNLSSSPKPVISFQEFKEHEKEFEVKKKEKKKFRKSKGRKFKKLTEKSDPNLLSKEEWMRLGLSSKQSDIVLKFSERGLRSNEDLKKIFVFPEELFELIKDSLFYPEMLKSSWKEDDYKETENNVKVKIRVDVNTADSVTLKTIPGIGPFFAGKIVQHRNDLGGFLSLNQLTEIWKFDEDKLTGIREYSFLSKIKLIKLDVNKASVDELVKHPYINYKIANSIVKMRTTNGSYTQIRDILKSKLITREIYNKLEPYIKIG
tara:strand:- start:473 stop:1339 length:867 start_codon:yes stop_codon:yes gene_type:complete